MPAPRTEITEIVTGLALFGARDVREALADPPSGYRNVDEEVWHRLAALDRDGQHRQEFAAAWANGVAFLHAAQGLRGREPLVIEWKGPNRAPGDEQVPADLRVDHVYLISCKYLSRVLANAAPQRLFDRALAGGPAVTGGDWYADVAPVEYQALYEVIRRELGQGPALPPHAADLTPGHRAALRQHLDAGWSDDAAPAYRTMAVAVGKASADRWRGALRRKAQQEAMLWRLLRIGSAPYFVLGAAAGRTLRLRIATPWDWRQDHELKRFDVWGDDAGQPQVRWQAVVRDRATGEDVAVDGHVEVRWSHGRFAKQPEAKVYLDTAHHRVPGYVTLT